MRKFLLSAIALTTFSLFLKAGSFIDYHSHIAADRIIVIFDKAVAADEQEATLKRSGLVTRFVRLPHPRLTICYTSDADAAQKYFGAQAGVTYVSFFITDGKGHYGGVMDDFFVKLADKSFEPQLQSILQANNLGAATADKYIPNLYHVSNTQYQIHNTIDWCMLLRNESWVQYAASNYLLNPIVNSNDPDYNREWQIHNTGSAVQGNGTPGADMKIDTAWTITTGDSTIKIGLIDSGTDTTHPDLKPNLLPGHDAVGDSTNGYPTPDFPDDGHGTCTAGILAAVKDNNIVIAGDAPSCKVIPVRAFFYADTFAQVLAISTAAIFADAIGWAWDSGHADILSNSWALPSELIPLLNGGTQPVEDALATAYTNGRNGKGVALFFSSGNADDSIGPLWPGYLPECISVNATNQCDTRKATVDCSNDAWGSDYGPGLEISAPGENMAVTDMMGNKGFSSTDYYLYFSGTSASCPNAAAVGALILSVNPLFTSVDVRNIIDQTCDKVGGYNYDSTFTNGTWCRELGYGRVNAYRAVTLAQTYTPTGISQPNERNELVISPNPAHDFVNVRYLGTEPVTLKIYDMTGKQVAVQQLHTGLNTTDVSLLASGIYLARIDNQGATSSTKVVVYR